MRFPTVPVPHGRALGDMELEIHCIETEAYYAVLKAFIAQSDVLSWGKEGLITELRKELRVSDVEHREILVHVDSDDSIRKIREWRKSTADQEGVLPHTAHSAGSIPGSTVHASSKRLKSANISLSSSPKYLPRVQPSPTTIPSSLAAHYRDGQWGDDMDIKSTRRNDGRTTKSVLNRHLPIAGKGRGCLKVKSDKHCTVSEDDYYHKGSDNIEIRETDKLILEVERVCGGENPDPVQLETAKLILREHERALLHALSKLDDASDGDGTPDHSPPRYLSGDFRRTGQASGPHHGGFAQVDRMRGYASKGLEMDHDNRVFPSFDRHGEDGNEGV